jgi:hypothetical protein
MIVEKRPIDITDKTKWIVAVLVKALQMVVRHSRDEKPELRAMTRVDANITFLKGTFLIERTIISTNAVSTPMVCNYATSIAFVFANRKYYESILPQRLYT